MEEADEVQPVESNINDTVVSVSAREQLQAEQLQDADIGPVLRLRLQRAEAPSINELLPESEATKIIGVNGNSWSFTTASSIVDASAKKGVQTHYNFWYRLQSKTRQDKTIRDKLTVECVVDIWDFRALWIKFSVEHFGLAGAEMSNDSVGIARAATVISVGNFRGRLHCSHC
jgi:hypothetical protein